MLTALPLRLQGQSSGNGTGRVEVLYNGKWGNICDDSFWDLDDARVVCRQLGYKYAVRTLQDGEVPYGPGPTWLHKVACRGSERNLTSCLHSGFGKKYCTKAAGVECSFTGKVISLFKTAGIMKVWNN
jgi:hypothetical protein